MKGFYEIISPRSSVWFLWTTVLSCQLGAEKHLAVMESTALCLKETINPNGFTSLLNHKEKFLMLLSYMQSDKPSGFMLGRNTGGVQVHCSMHSSFVISKPWQLTYIRTSTESQSQKDALPICLVPLVIACWRSHVIHILSQPSH